jgi:diaminopimelate epimerase
VILRFSKYEGLGNDFVIVSDDYAAALTPAIVQRICDRNFGVGADGVLIVGQNSERPSMRVINADGSRPEMCGNGLRCVALYLVNISLARGTARFDQRGSGPSSFVVDTEAGPHPVEVDLALPARFDRTPRSAQVKVWMRPASLEAHEVLREQSGEWIGRAFSCDNRELAMTTVSMGNPHAVIFSDKGFERAEMASLGPRIERDPRFVAGANVGFARLKSPTALDLTVWERGVGFTLACGTGACAAAVAAVETGRSPRGRELEVTLPGGPLRIVVPARGEPIQMTGPAVHVFDGELELDALVDGRDSAGKPAKERVAG